MTSLRGFPTNFLQVGPKVATHWRPTKINIHTINPRLPIKFHGPQIKAGKVVVFFGTWNFIKFHGPQKTISDLSSTWDFGDVPVGDVWVIKATFDSITKLNASPWNNSH